MDFVTSKIYPDSQFEVDVGFFWSPAKQEGGPTLYPSRNLNAMPVTGINTGRKPGGQRFLLAALVRAFSLRCPYHLAASRSTPRPVTPLLLLKRCTVERSEALSIAEAAFRLN